MAAAVGLAEDDALEEQVAVVDRVRDGVAEALRGRVSVGVGLVSVREAALSVGCAVQVAVRDRERVAVPEAVAENRGLRVAVPVGVPVRIAEGVGVGAVAVAVAVALRVRDPVAVGALRVAEAVRVGTTVRVFETVPDCDFDGDAVGVGLPVGVDAVREATLPEAVAVRLQEDGEREGVRVPERLPERLPEWVCDADGGDRERVWVGGVGDRDRDGVALAEGLGAERLREGLVWLRDAVTEGVPLPEPDREAVGEAVAEVDGPSLQDTEGVAVEGEALRVAAGVTRMDRVAVGVAVGGDAVAEALGGDAVRLRVSATVGERVGVGLGVPEGLRERHAERVGVRVPTAETVPVGVRVAVPGTEGERLPVPVGDQMRLWEPLRVGVAVEEMEALIAVGVPEVGVGLPDAVAVGVTVAVAGRDPGE